MRGHRLRAQKLVKPGEWDMTVEPVHCVRSALWVMRCECRWKSAPLPFTEALDAHTDHLRPIRETRVATVS